MKIEINESEIHDAIIAHVETMGISLSGKDLKVKLTAGRTVNGSTAEITITPKSNTAEVVPITVSNEPEENLEAANPDRSDEEPAGSESDDSIFQQ